MDVGGQEAGWQVRMTQMVLESGLSFPPLVVRQVKAQWATAQLIYLDEITITHLFLHPS